MRRSVYVIIISVLMISCSSSPTQPPPLPAGQARVPVATQTANPASILANYRLTPGDVLDINVFRESEMSGKYTVEQSGSINFPLIGKVTAAGLSADNLERKLKFELSQGYLVNPDVRVSVAKYRPIYVGGAVKSPSEYAYKPGMTAQQATTLAGGVTRFASKDKIYIQRYGTSPEEAYRVTPETLLFPGDIISVQERLF